VDAPGIFGSRRTRQSTCDSVPVRLLAADTHPDHDTFCPHTAPRGVGWSDVMALLLKRN
jgi:hypothetical protein